MTLLNPSLTYVTLIRIILWLPVVNLLEEFALDKEMSRKVVVLIFACIQLLFGQLLIGLNKCRLGVNKHDLAPKTAPN